MISFSRPRLRLRMHGRGRLREGSSQKMLIFQYMNIAKIYHNEAQFLAITSLSTEEFDQLLRPFAHAWQQWYKHYNFRTWRGAIHDKAMAEQELPAFERLPAKDIWMVKDTGYQRYCPEGVILLEPFKAKRGHPLSKLQKQINAWISSIRVTVEHAIGGVKRLRLVSEKWRGKVPGRIDKAMAIAAGLHNLRVVSRAVDHTCTQARARARLEIFRS